MKKLLRRISGKFGYEIRNLKYIPRQLAAGDHTLNLSFDHVIYRHMAERQGPGPFFFIQVGAFDGKDCDPLYKFIKRYGWHGILLEPQPDAFRRLQTLHSGNDRLVLLNAALSATRGKAELYTLEGEDLPSWSKGMASFNRGNIVKHKPLLPAIEDHIRKIEIDCTTFDDLFRRSTITRLDLLQIDTEGFDAEVIRLFPFGQIKPEIIQFESKHLGKAVLEGLLDRLTAMNYRVAHSGEEDMLAVLAQE